MTHFQHTGDMKRGGDLRGNGFHLAHGLHVELLRGQHQGGIPAVHARILHMLRDGVVQDASLLGHGVELDLLRIRVVLAVNRRGEVIKIKQY